MLRRCFSLPWLLIGDFNKILLPHEVKDSEFVFRRVAKFAEVIDSYSLMDVGSSSSFFTWCQTIQGRRIVSKRFDRALGC